MGVVRGTLQRIPTPTAILVVLPDALAEACIDVLSDAGVKVLRVGSVAAAAERIPVTMPQLVIVSNLMIPAELDIVIDRCVAVGAEVLKLDPDTPPRATGALVRTAARNALIKALAGS
jgi:hypothetical protein